MTTGAGSSAKKGFLLYVAVDGRRTEIETAWLVPSTVLDAEAFRVAVKGKQHVRFQASVKEASEDKWRRFRMPRDEVPPRLLEIITSVEPDAVEDEDPDD